MYRTHTLRRRFLLKHTRLWTAEESHFEKFGLNSVLFFFFPRFVSLLLYISCGIVNNNIIKYRWGLGVSHFILCIFIIFVHTRNRAFRIRHRRCRYFKWIFSNRIIHLRSVGRCKWFTLFFTCHSKQCGIISVPLLQLVQESSCYLCVADAVLHLSWLDYKKAINNCSHFVRYTSVLNHRQMAHSLIGNQTIIDRFRWWMVFTLSRLWHKLIGDIFLDFPIIMSDEYMHRKSIHH